MTDTAPCSCWTRQPALPHQGHCCFGYREDDAYEYGKTPPCGHWHPDVPRPPKLTEEQAQAWARRRCIGLCGRPARAGGYRCDSCHQKNERREAVTP